MEIIELTYPHSLNQSDLPETVAAIGLFDGIHVGHQQVIHQAIEQATKEGKMSAVITFHPNPAVVLSGGKKPANYILPLEEKFSILEKMGVDRVYNITFNKELSQLSPEEFLSHFIINLHITHLVAGFDYSFGYKGAGNMDNISTYMNGEFTYTVIEQLKDTDEKVSSTRIRKELGAGNVAEVSRLLGRPYTTTGLVVEGDKRGRTIGFPTANMEIDNELRLPAQGVYAVRTFVDGEEFIGMANLGFVPTFKTGEPALSLEVYILDFDQNIYGKQITIAWLEKIRNEKKFSGIDEIVAQLTVDEAKVRKLYM